MANGKLSGTFTVSGKEGTRTGTWTAERPASGKPTSPRTLDFVPTEFHRQFSADISPVMHIWPGDVVRTKSVDAGGQDEKGAQRVAGGSPVTGPFYVEGAMPGDVLVVTIKTLRTNRDWAMSDSAGGARVDYLASEHKQDWKAVKWHLDAQKQVATIQDAPEALKNFQVPLQPMLGCVAVAPSPWDVPLQTQHSGDLGGNMGFNRIREGASCIFR